MVVVPNDFVVVVVVVGTVVDLIVVVLGIVVVVIAVVGTVVFNAELLIDVVGTVVVFNDELLKALLGTADLNEEVSRAPDDTTDFIDDASTAEEGTAVRNEELLSVEAFIEAEAALDVADDESVLLLDDGLNTERLSCLFTTAARRGSVFLASLFPVAPVAPGFLLATIGILWINCFSIILGSALIFTGLIILPGLPPTKPTSFKFRFRTWPAFVFIKVAPA